MMTRDQLVEALAAIEAGHEWRGEPPPYDDLPAWRKAGYRARAMEGWPLFVEFVAAWIEDHNGWGDEGALENARLWREEMAEPGIPGTKA